MAFFFKPSDIKTIECCVNNKTRGGSAFAVCEDGTQVFIQPKIVDLVSIDVGDLLTAYCIDNHRPESDGADHYAVKWRAVRVTVKERFDPIPAALPLAVPVAKPELTNEQIEQSVMDMMVQWDRAWTTAQASAYLSLDQMRVSNVMRGLHDKGRIATASLEAQSGQDRVSKLYYARDVDLLVELIDEVELDD